MNRRQMMSAASAAGVLGFAGASPAFAAPDSLKDAARDAYLYGLPIVEMARVRAGMIRAAAQNGGFGINRLSHNRALAGPHSRTVTSPNVDTLYSGAMLDLASGPATLTLPPTGGRYFCFAFMDFYTNNFCILGTRTTGRDGGRFTIVGPTAAAPPEAIRAPTPWVWAVARVLIAGPGDLDAAHKVQDGIVLEAGPARTPAAFADRKAPWPDYFDSVQRLLAENPPPATDMGFFRKAAPLGLGPLGGFDAARFSPAQAADVAAGEQAAMDWLLHPHRVVQPINGWTYPTDATGDFGQDYEMRAAVALGGLGALPRIEAMYMGAMSPDGGPIFNDDRLHRLSFAAGQEPPAKAFWSLTMYETADGQSYLTDNPLNRYAIGDRTKGLRRNADGSLDIWIGRNDPGDGRRSNWLPAPKHGAFRMSMRCYLPSAALLNGDYRLPPIVVA